MAKLKHLATSERATKVELTAEDWKAAETSLIQNLYVQCEIVRVFEETLLALSKRGLVHGPAHSSIGQEGAAVGSAVALGIHDSVNGTHRGHHQFLAKSLSFLNPKGFEVKETALDREVEELIEKTFAEILGLKTGFNGGRGGSMHLQWLEAGALGTNAIVGGGVPLAAGNAWAQTHESFAGDVTVTYFGDGAFNIGSTLETMNLAAAWKLPLCFFIENNGYAVSTAIDDVVGESTLALRGPGFGIKSWQIDGMDPLAVYHAQKEARAHMAAGKGPTLIEAKTYRYFHQSGHFTGSAFGYRTKEEEAEWRSKDPLDRLAAELEERGTLSKKERSERRKTIEEKFIEITERLLETSGSEAPKQQIREDLWPDTNELGVHVVSDLTGFAPTEPRTEEKERKKFIKVISETLHRRMDQDSSVVVLGEDVHRLKGGTNGATKGLVEDFPERTLGTPISEAAFTGFAGGLAMTGEFRPIVEYMYPDFLWVAADQAFNQIGKARSMYGGSCAMPVILRTKVAMGTGYGSQHSMDPAGIFAAHPGWRIIAPSNAEDYIGLFNTAISLKDPVLVIEHVDLYSTDQEVPKGDRDFTLPVGQAAIRRQGKRLTILSYLSMVDIVIDVVDELGLDAEIVDLRWLDRNSIDWDTISESVEKTGNLMIIEQGARGTSYGAWLSDEAQRRFSETLESPVHRLTGAMAPPPVSKILESAANASREDVRRALVEFEEGF
ncbi:alpha-ketoacid dehydrogenase subunit alpha/beta [Corynebacterium flavescens]|uniref:alpha-ketoacid dehydrogenase subunit alpha/beta n=1 Tax=Corynebacterium flavescens TaxID=28028 RepID=UPI002899E1B7|nr:thiamine pyrophosphate-dependent enzyme [Corynebacterium flavescens]